MPDTLGFSTIRVVCEVIVIVRQHCAEAFPHVATVLQE